MSTFSFPKLLYGPTAEVLSTVRRHVTLILRENSLQSVLEAPRLEVMSYPGRIVLARAGIASASEPSFHADLLWLELSNRLLKQSIGLDAFTRLSSLAQMGLAEPWWFAGLLLSQSYFLVNRAARQLEFLDHARAHWSILLSVEHLYSPHTRLETTPTLVHYCLARQGAAILKPPLQPLTTERLNDLLDHLPGYGVRRLAQDRPNDVAPLLQGHEDIAFLSLAEHLVDFGHDALACELVRLQNRPDPHGITGRRLAGADNPDRIVG